MGGIESIGNFSTTACNLAFSCSNETFNVLFNCYGYKSCAQSSMLINNGWQPSLVLNDDLFSATLWAPFDCSGSRSCADTTYYDEYLSEYTLNKIKNYADTNDTHGLSEWLEIDFRCSGWRSCDSMNLYTNLMRDYPFDINITPGLFSSGSFSRAFVIDCSGDQSCVNGSFTNITRIKCSGERSCWNVTAQMAYKDYAAIAVYGHLGAQNATFSLNGGGSVDFGGAWSGYGAKVICGNYETCNVTCFSNGCNHILAECQNMGSDCLIKLSGSE